jgi:hypothetical protein
MGKKLITLILMAPNLFKEQQWPNMAILNLFEQAFLIDPP